MDNTSEIRPFRIDIPQTDLDDLGERLARARWAEELPGVGWDYGVSSASVKALVEYWRDRYDWRGWEARLNEYPQFTTTIDGQNIHFLHVRSPHENALPLILTHGWPGSIVEYLNVIEPLTNPAYGGQAFHLVIPSLPGFGFSGPTTDKGWGTNRTATAWAELMRRLGYDRYGAAGNDAGSMISPVLGRIDAEHVLGVHVTQVFAFPSGDPAEFVDMSAEDMAAMQKLQWFFENKFAFNQLHSQQPQTLAHALADSPSGLLGWHLQLMAGDAMGDKALDEDFILTNAAIYWLTNTAGSSIRFYYEDAKGEKAPTEPTTVPIGLAGFSGDFSGVRRFAERDHKNLVQWHTYDAPGGHYAAHLAPDLLTEDIRQFFAKLS
jgi:pimeloyl-ACP methyl ester carboxylesterase